MRISDRPIRERCQVREPGYLIIQDQSLLHVPGVTDGLLSSGAILVNSAGSSESLSALLGRDAIAMNAVALAREYIGRPVPNTALLAGFLALTELLPLDALMKALTARFKGEILERNMRLLEAAAAQVPAGRWREVADVASA